MAKVKKAVFPAAGLGTRFLPATKAQPKEMLPLVDKPIIQYVVEEAVASGIESIIFVTGRGKNAIEDHFDVSYELERILEERKKYDLLNLVTKISDMIPISYVRQKEALGLGHAVLMARDLVNDQPFAVLLGDDIIDSDVPCLKQMMDVFDICGASVIGIQEVSRDEISSYGVVAAEPADILELGPAYKGRLYRVTKLVEKPRPEEAPSNLAIIGRYVLTPEIFKALAATEPDAGGEIQLTNALARLLGEQPIYAYRFRGKRHDAGNKLGFIKATIEFALKREDLGKPLREYLKSLDLS